MHTVRAVVCALAFVCFSTSAIAQKSGQVQPDSIKFGEVYQGAIVEGSFLVYEAGNDPNIDFEVTAPKFAQVLQKTTRHVEYRRVGNFILGVVRFRVDTTKVGETSGDFTVTLGSSKVSVPISATIKPTKGGRSRVLVAESPVNAIMGSGNNVTWTELVRDASLDVNYLSAEPDRPVLRDLDLAKYQCVLLADLGLIFIQPEDVKRLREFAEGGGKVILAANYFRGGSVPKANEILEGSAIRIQDTEGRTGTQRVTLEESDLSSLLTDAGVKSACFFRASPISVLDPRAGQVLVKAKGVGYESDGFVAVADVGKGQMIAIGQPSWWSWINPKQAAGTDNVGLLRWLLTPPK
jgi:hypothetical protein